MMATNLNFKQADKTDRLTNLLKELFTQAGKSVIGPSKNESDIAQMAIFTNLLGQEGFESIESAIRQIQLTFKRGLPSVGDILEIAMAEKWNTFRRQFEFHVFEGWDFWHTGIVDRFHSETKHLLDENPNDYALAQKGPSASAQFIVKGTAWFDSDVYAMVELLGPEKLKYQEKEWLMKEVKEIWEGWYLMRKAEKVKINSQPALSSPKAQLTEGKGIPVQFNTTFKSNGFNKIGQLISVKKEH